jgi:hypothetical protein
MDTKNVTLEYIGPANQEWYDGDKTVSLVPGRRYQIPEALATYMVEHDTGHWKRPTPPRATAAVKE